MEKLSGTWPRIYQEYQESYMWTESFITDPTGLRYLNIRNLSPQERLAEEKAKLDRMARLLHFLGNPQERYKAIHVTGTNGKGSVSTMISAILQETAPSVGLHTSPYVQIPNEKLIINGKMIKPSAFTEYVHYLRNKLSTYPGDQTDLPRYGELWTALAHVVFAASELNWGVYEVGMGGRFDSSNIINSKVAVITNIDFDHVVQLGPTLADIAWQKAGIIKPNIPTVTGVTQPELLEVIHEEAEINHSQVLAINKEFKADNIRLSGTGTYADLHTPFGVYRDVYINLLGTFQATNALIAVVSAQLAAKSEGSTLSEAQIRRALEGVNFPGRFEAMQDTPLVVLDGAHNPAKILALTDLLRSNFGEKDITLIIGMLKTKDVESSLITILPHVQKVITTEPDIIGKPSLDAKEMKALVNALQPNIEVSSEKNVQSAIEKGLRQISNPHKEMIVITGSVYMLGKARNYWHPTENLLHHLEFQT